MDFFYKIFDIFSYINHFSEEIVNFKRLKRCFFGAFSAPLKVLSQKREHRKLLFPDRAEKKCKGKIHKNGKQDRKDQGAVSSYTGDKTSMRKIGCRSRKDGTKERAQKGIKGACAQRCRAVKKNKVDRRRHRKKEKRGKRYTHRTEAGDERSDGRKLHKNTDGKRKHRYPFSFECLQRGGADGEQCREKNAKGKHGKRGPRVLCHIRIRAKNKG